MTCCSIKHTDPNGYFRDYDNGAASTTFIATERPRRLSFGQAYDGSARFLLMKIRAVLSLYVVNPFSSTNLSVTTQSPTLLVYHAGYSPAHRSGPRKCTDVVTPPVFVREQKSTGRCPFEHDYGAPIDHAVSLEQYTLGFRGRTRPPRRHAFPPDARSDPALFWITPI